MKQIPIPCKVLFLALSLFFADIPANAQYDYIPLVEEGKVWNYGEDTNAGSAPVYSYIIAGDTIIDGNSFKKLFKQTHDDGMTIYHAAIREDEKRVSVIMADSCKEKQLYDFCMSVGSIFTVGNMRLQYFPYWYAKGSDGHIRQVLLMKWNLDHITDTIPVAGGSSVWVEGLGAFEADLFDPAGLHREYVFQSCYRESVCLFVFDDIFNIVSPDGIVETRKNGRNTTSSLHGFFDLQGRRLTTQPRCGLYIKDGRKMVVK